MLLLCKLVMGAPGKYCPGKEGQEEAMGEGEERDAAESWPQLAEPTPGATKIQLWKPSPKLVALALAVSPGSSLWVGDTSVHSQLWDQPLLHLHHQCTILMGSVILGEPSETLTFSCCCLWALSRLVLWLGII